MPRKHVIGQRGRVLISLGCVWVCIGAVSLLADLSLGYPLMAVAAPLKGAAWIITGLVALGYAFKSQGSDMPGFYALFAMIAIRILLYGTGFAIWAISPGHTYAIPIGAVAAIGFGVLLYHIVVLSAWREPIDDGSDTL